MALDKKSEKELEDYFKQKLSEAYYQGMAVGVKTVCHAVLDILNDTSIQYAKRIKKAKKFCEKPLKSESKKEDSGAPDVSAEETENEQ